MLIPYQYFHGITQEVTSEIFHVINIYMHKGCFLVFRNVNVIIRVKRIAVLYVSLHVPLSTSSPISDIYFSNNPIIQFFLSNIRIKISWENM